MIIKGQRTSMAKSLKIPKDNQKKQINEGQRTQWPKVEYTKGLIRRHKSMKDREHNGQKFEDTEGERTKPKV